MAFRTLLKMAPILLPALAMAHSGGTDDLGCHNDRQDGGYHCHSGPLDGREFASQAQARKALKSDGPTSGNRRSASGGYDRALYGGWDDKDGDCQDTRTEVLIQEADGLIRWETTRHCEIASGTWKGSFTGDTFHDPSKLHIDHLVPLKEAHGSGAAEWSPRRKHAYATNLEDRRVLIAVEAGANMSKGADDPADWMPPNEDFHCPYLRRWKGIKADWGLEMDREEKGFIDRRLRECR